MDSEQRALVMGAASNMITAARWLLERRKKRRRWWVRPVNTRREMSGEFHTLVKEITVEDPELFFKYFRMSSEKLQRLLELVGPAINKKTTYFREPISPRERLSITIRYLATGECISDLAMTYRVGHSTASKIIAETCTELYNVLQPLCLKQSAEADWERIASKMMLQWQFPNCLGALDGKHIRVQCPANSQSKFFNYKKYFSIVLLALCDAEYCFTFIDVGAYGSSSDGAIFRESSLGTLLETGTADIPRPAVLPGTNVPTPFVCVGDEAFPLKTYLMRPFPGHRLPVTKRIFNYRLCRVRRLIENTFGILAARWRVFHRPIMLKTATIDKVVKAACALHNFLQRQDNACNPGTRRYCPAGFVDAEDRSGASVEGEWRQIIQNDTGITNLPQTGSNNYTYEASITRDRLTEFFNGVGAVPWQNRML